MCELMGLSFERPLSADLSFRAFSTRGEENADGWGLAWYPDRAAAIVKEPVKWGESRFARFLEAYPSLQSPLYIAHVRHKTTGQPSYADTHPFSRERAGREYCFAHNGTLEGPIWTLSTGHHNPLGNTDSERAFCHLLDELDRRGGHLERQNDWQWLHTRLSELNRLGTLNVLLADGVRLFAYHDESAWKGLTFRRIRVGEHQVRHLGDEALNIDLKGTEVSHGFVIATCPLDGEAWHRFQTGELVVFEAGVARFSSHRNTASPEFSPTMRPE
ncbi:MAG TPA: class II glutamine amidotransferase [Isosphaeraceae bacterium]|jgi:glutamine amidotransferase|nr:class II glutamine amidotransferase [Isosphaeraceae bacterium]